MGSDHNQSARAKSELPRVYTAPLPEGARIAVIGSGAAGLVAAWLLDRRYRVTLIEAADYIGGHTNTVTVPDGPDAGTPIDTGFIVMNRRNYPLLTRILETLDVALRDSNMSFSYFDRASGLQYAGTGIDALFAQRRNALRPAFWRMLADVRRFYRRAAADLDAGALDGLSLGGYLSANGYGKPFLDWHILPMGAAIWSTPEHEMLDFPAASFVRFFRNHGLLTFRDRPQWSTVAGGSRTYVERILEGFGGEVCKGAAAVEVTRAAGRFQVRLADGRALDVDAGVMAAHADQALALLSDPSDSERRLLGPWRYQRNRTVLHTSDAWMPTRRKAWASWNYIREPSENGAPPRLTVTYYMNRLQGLQTSRPYFVTLNCPKPVDGAHVVAEMEYDHPTYTWESMATQSRLPELNGVRNTYFCGSYFGYGFHEDAVRSGAEVAARLGVSL